MTLQSFLSSRTGKRFYNFCYCWGACLVILGAVSKIAYLPYSNIFLMVGLITEVLIFFISGFDEPSREYKWERVFPILNSKTANTDPQVAATNINLSSFNQLTSETSKIEIAKLEENIKKLSEAYETQLKQANKQMELLNSMQQADLQQGIQQMAVYIELLNKQYKQMLDALNVKTEK